MPLRRLALPILLLLAASAAAAMGVGCGGLGVSADSAFGGAADGLPTVGAEDAGGSGPFAAPSDAGVTPPPPPHFKSNALCAYTSRTCDPQRDNLGDPETSTSHVCAKLLTNDAGAPDADVVDAGGAAGDAGIVPAPRYACHVGRNPSGPGVAPICLPEGDTTGTCTASAQCEAGHECVGTGASDPQCRPYCCDANACDATSFCDVQPIVASSGTMVPVCMPVASCELLSPSVLQCPGQQCGLALNAKSIELRTCLDVGQRGVAEDCETDHCAKDLACLGAPGARKCFQLCDTAQGAGTGTHECPMGQLCSASGPTFKGTVGICGL